MKKTLFYAAALMLSAGMMTACGNSENCTAENCTHENCTCENCTEECTNEACAQTAAEEVAADLQDGTPVEVDVEGAEVVNEGDGAQQVETEVTMTPEQAQ